MEEGFSFKDYRFPKSLRFYLPGQTDETTHRLNYDDDKTLHRQLVFWYCVQSYWKYVIEMPTVSDEVYQDIKEFIISMESEAEYLSSKHSPSKELNLHNIENYPTYVQTLFKRIGLDVV